MKPDTKAQRLLSMVAALAVPGITLVLRGRRLILGSVLLLLAVGSALNLVIASRNLSSGIESFDMMEAISIPHMLELWPIARQAEPATDPAAPVLAENDRWPLQRHFWPVLFGHVLLLVLALLVSGWFEWREPQKECLAREGLV